MKNLPLCRIAVLAALTACTSGVPYRNGDYKALAECAKRYNDYDAAMMSVAEPPVEDSENCWKQSRESHRDYDVLFVEFDDQGWVQDAANDSNPTKADHLTKLYESINQIRGKPDKPQQRLSIVVFVHGWQHNAEATDSNVHAFRKLLRQVDALEAAAANQGRPRPRVVGIYVGWRGKSLTTPVLNNITFWERKNTAEKVAQGQIQELFRWLDLLRDAGTEPITGERNVTVLTIGHSFGGLITFEALGGEFVRNAVRFKHNVDKPDDQYMSRIGDLVVIANPAFEGARYEGLRAAARRLEKVERNQLPVVIVATSEADVATKFFFPLARWFNTIFESTSGEEQSATVLAVGHNPRYITHDLSLCKSAACQAVCSNPQQAGDKSEAKNTLETKASREYAHMFRIAKDGFDRDKPKPSQQYLCEGLELKWTQEAYPDHNPFWVVRTTEDIMHGHNDIFNANMIAFVRQMYTGFIAARIQYNEKARSQAKIRK